MEKIGASDSILSPKNIRLKFLGKSKFPIQNLRVKFTIDSNVIWNKLTLTNTDMIFVGLTTQTCSEQSSNKNRNGYKGW